jgi:ElaB/YqjD/DUF883 family membrane-anchored ribosome-binding protein
VEEDEPNYYDELLSASNVTDLTVAAAAATASIRITIKELWHLLEKKGYVTQEDKNELNANIKKTMEQMRKATKRNTQILPRESRNTTSSTHSISRCRIDCNKDVCKDFVQLART